MASQRRTCPRTEPVCPAEKVSVERKKMSPAHRMAGHQARSQAGMMELRVMREAASTAGNGTKKAPAHGCRKGRYACESRKPKRSSHFPTAVTTNLRLHFQHRTRDTGVSLNFPQGDSLMYQLRAHTDEFHLGA